MTSKGSIFRKLHEEAGAFIIPNPWDAGSAKILAASGFKALATTSSGMAFTLGYPEGRVPRDLAFAHCKAIVDATLLPVSADLERGFGDSPDEVAQAIRDAAATGLAGGSIEDHTGSVTQPIYEFSLAVERIAAAAEEARRCPDDFVLTARCECLLWGSSDIEDVIRRLQAFEQAGADVLFAPGLRDLSTIRTVCSALTKPVNVVIETAAEFTADELADAGVKRISTGSKLACLAYGGLLGAIDEMTKRGTFSFADNAARFEDIAAYFR